MYIVVIQRVFFLKEFIIYLLCLTYIWSKSITVVIVVHGCLMTHKSGSSSSSTTPLFIFFLPFHIVQKKKETNTKIFTISYIIKTRRTRAHTEEASSIHFITFFSHHDLNFSNLIFSLIVEENMHIGNGYP